MIDLNSKTSIALISAAFTAVATLVVGVSTGAFSYFNKDRELDLKMVDISLTILSGDHDTKNSLEARKFALRALSKYADVEIPDTELETWANQGILPQGSFNTDFRRFMGGAVGIAGINSDPFGINSSPAANCVAVSAYVIVNNLNAPSNVLQDETLRVILAFRRSTKKSAWEYIKQLQEHETSPINRMPIDPSVVRRFSPDKFKMTEQFCEAEMKKQLLVRD